MPDETPRSRVGVVGYQCLIPIQIRKGSHHQPGQALFTYKRQWQPV